MEGINPTPRRRRRPALSCNPCRSRKVRCNRALPSCSRCLHSRNAYNCSYNEETLSNPQFKPRETSRQTTAITDRVEVEEISQPDVQLDVQPDVQPDVQLDVQLDVQPDVQADVQLRRHQPQEQSYNPPNETATGIYNESGLQRTEADGNSPRHPVAQREQLTQLDPRLGLFSFHKVKNVQTRFYGATFSMNMYPQVRPR